MVSVGGALALALLGNPRPADAAIAYIQSASQDPVSATSVTVNYAAAQNAGDLNVVVIGWANSTAQVNSVTDSKGNNYLVAVGPTTLAHVATQVIYYAPNIAAAAAGTNTVTVTFNSAVPYPDVRVVEYSGISTSNPFDVGVGASSITGTSTNSGSVTTGNANDLLVGANSIGDVFAAAGSGYTVRVVTNPDSDLVEDQTVTATGSYSATATQVNSSWWVMQLAAFRASTGSGGDTTPPTAPSNLAATAPSSSQVNLTWTASTDNVGVTGYIVYRCSGASCTSFAKIGTSPTTTYSDSGLNPSTSYSYQVFATDAAGNVSTASNTATAITSSGGDTTPPTAPSNLKASAISSTQINLGWTLSTDNVGVTGYRIERCSGSGCTGFAQIGTSTTTSYNDTGLSVSSSYTYRVRATDAAGNLSGYSNLATAITSAVGSVTAISPRNAALTQLQTQQFTTTSTGGPILNWSVDGIAGGNSTVGTVSSSGLYTPPASGAGTHNVTATNASNSANSVTAAVAVTNLTGITTWHNDLARTGQNLQEYALTPATVTSGRFGKRWSCTLDGGTVYAQPLYVANLSIGGGVHNVLFIVTMHDTIYAFDADSGSCTPYWKVSYINPGSGINTISSADSTCDDIVPEYGITGTPVIDPVAQTIYFVTSTNESGTYYQRLHAVNIQTGAERANSPQVIAGTYPGNGDGSNTTTFNPLYQNQRPGLVLTGGGIIIAWGSRCDNFLWPWHGWVMRFDATSLQQTAVFNATPNGPSGYGGIWMSGAAPALDNEDNMFLSTGNGTFDDTSATLPAPKNDFGESFLNLSPVYLTVQDFYTPSMNATWTANDLDIASAGITVLPDGVGPSGHGNVLIGADKQGHLWMIDRSRMSGYLPGADNTVQYLALSNPSGSQEVEYATPAYWNGTVYVSISYGHVIAFHLSNGYLPFSGTTEPETAVPSSQSNETYSYPNGTPSISASPSGGGIAWVLDNNANGTDNGSGNLGPAVLRAYDATNLGTTLYSSSTLAADTSGNAAKFTLPVVANGHVYVVGTNALTVYGLAP